MAQKQADLSLPVFPSGCCNGPADVQLPAEMLERMAAVLKALGHPVRLQIIYILSKLGGKVCVCDIEQQFDIKQPTISHHLRVLREAGLVAGEQRGLWVYYYIKPDMLSFLSTRLEEMAG